MTSDEELLHVGRRPVNRRVWLGGLVVALLVVGAVIVVRVWPHSSGKPLAAATEGPPTSAPVTATQPWPKARTVCGGTVELPIVTSVPVQRPTGLRLLVGGSRLSTIDFDSGASLAEGGLRHGEGVLQLVGGSPGYAVAARCDWRRGLRLFSLGSAGRGTSVQLASWADLVMADRLRLWAVGHPSDTSDYSVLRRIGGGPRVRLPHGFTPVGITHGIVAGETGSAEWGTDAVELVDAASGKVREHLGRGQVLAVGAGVVVWTVGCEPGGERACGVHWRSVTGGRTAGAVLPRSPGFDRAAAVRPDGQLLAFTLERPALDSRYENNHPFPPTTVALLNLRSGTLTTAHYLELPPKTAPGLAFSPDGRWLVIALDAGTKTRLLAWQPGMATPYETSALTGLAVTPPPLMVLSGSD